MHRDIYIYIYIYLSLKIGTAPGAPRVGEVASGDVKSSRSRGIRILEGSIQEESKSAIQEGSIQEKSRKDSKMDSKKVFNSRKSRVN